MLTIRGLSPLSLARLPWSTSGPPTTPLHVLICLADHFEPKRASSSPAVWRDRVARWVREYPLLAGPYVDSRGRTPQHTFFYPAEEYEPELLDALASLCRQGWGDVEVHLHHDRDTSDSLREKLVTFAAELHENHGLLARDASGRITYGFIHGNWALDNSRPDGRWCGVNDELSILMETGCYADFTLPSAPGPCQTRTVNSIYYAQDDPLRPKSHDRGTIARVAAAPPPESLLMIQGPLALDWTRRKRGLFPTLENGDLTGMNPPTLARLWNWLAADVCVAGNPHWRFVKLHTHGAWEANTGMLLGEPMAAFHQALRDFADRQDGFHFYYVTAREMAAAVHALENDEPISLSTSLANGRLPAMATPSRPQSILRSAQSL